MHIGTCMLWHTCRGQRTTLWNQFSFCLHRIQTTNSGRKPWQQVLLPLNHLASPALYVVYSAFHVAPIISDLEASLLPGPVSAIAFSYPACLEGRAMSDAHRDGHWPLVAQFVSSRKTHHQRVSSFCVMNHTEASRSQIARLSCPLSSGLT